MIEVVLGTGGRFAGQPRGSPRKLRKILDREVTSI